MPAFVARDGSALDRSHAGRCAWLSDTQVNLTGAQPAAVSRTVYGVTSPDGLQGAANLQLDFNPRYESLTYHHVRVIRAGVTREVDPLASLEVLRRERNLERAIFDGRLTANISIDDVQVGDIVDICYGRGGSHPFLAGRFCQDFMLDWQCWVGQTRVRLITQPARPMTTQGWNGAPQCEIEHAPDGSLVRTWRTVETMPVVFESHMPSWIRPFVGVRICDVMTWSDVAATFAGHYGSEPLPAELEATIAALEGETGDAAARIVRVLRLVQGGLRYQAVSIGDGGFAPRPLEQIWSSRTGDCKDASQLMVAVLCRLGIEAWPVLVNTDRGRALKDEAPSLVSFNHCVVGLTLDGRGYWLDPTAFPQGGDLDRLCQCRFGWALPLRPGADLEFMGEDALSDSFDVSEVYELPRGVTEPGRLTVTSTFFGWRADLVRRQLSNGLDAFDRERAARQAKRFDTASQIEPIRVSDDLDANRLELVETFKLGRVWRIQTDGRAVFATPDDLFSGNIPTMPVEGRRWPIWLGPVLRATSTIETRSPLPSPPRGWVRSFDIPGVKATSRMAAVDAAEKVLRLSRTLTFERSVLDAAEAGALAELVKDLTAKASLAVRQPVRNGSIYKPLITRKKPVANTGLAYAIMSTAIAILLFIFLMALSLVR